MIHRDIRPSNFVVRGGLPVIIDFGCAITMGTEAPYEGSRCYANFRFLPLSEKKHHTFRYLPADDLVSFVLTVYAIFNTSQGDIELCPTARADTIKEFWESRLPKSWWDFITSIAGSSNSLSFDSNIYAQVKEFFN